MPLRPLLYHRLEHQFGDVKIAYEGEAMRATVVRDALTRSPQLQVSSAGEYYQICCPYCFDTRHRLWINHLWGFYDARTRSHNLWLATCFNENCLSVSGRARELWNQIFILGNLANYQGPDSLHRGTTTAVPLTWADPPGKTVPLADCDAEHAARAYLAGRGYDSDLLSRVFGVSICLEADDRYRPAANRIIIPIWFAQKFVGWQARYIGEPQDSRTPKYYTCPGMRKRQIIYNFDTARRYPFTVVTEGVTKVWRFGPEAVALLGKQASPTQIQLLQSTWGPSKQASGAVVILLDEDAAVESQALVAALNRRVRHVIEVRVPGDPGDYKTSVLREIVFAAARQQGVELAAAVAGPATTFG
jgi:hypothetical protein